METRQKRTEIRWRRRADVAFIDLRGRILAIPLTVEPTPSPYAMQASVAEIWRVLSTEAQPFDAIADQLSVIYSVETDSILDDLVHTLIEMEKRELVESVTAEA